MKNHFEGENFRQEREMSAKEVAEHMELAHEHLEALREALVEAQGKLEVLKQTDRPEVDELTKLQEEIAELEAEISSGEPYTNLMEEGDTEFFTTSD